jgi:hypothetical protein
MSTEFREKTMQGEPKLSQAVDSYEQNDWPTTPQVRDFLGSQQHKAVRQQPFSPYVYLYLHDEEAHELPFYVEQDNSVIHINSSMMRFSLHITYLQIADLLQPRPFGERKENAFAAHPGDKRGEWEWE